MIIAIGTSPNPIIFKGSEGLEQNRRSTVVAEDETGATSKPGVFAQAAMWSQGRNRHQRHGSRQEGGKGH